MSLLNSHFIREVFDSEEKFHDFAITVRYWAFRYELGGFTGRHNSTSFRYQLVSRASRMYHLCNFYLISATTP